MRKLGYGILAIGLVLAASAANASAGNLRVVPEINPASMSAGLALLTGGVMLARAYFRK